MKYKLTGEVNALRYVIYISSLFFPANTVCQMIVDKT